VAFARSDVCARLIRVPDGDFGRAAVSGIYDASSGLFATRAENGSVTMREGEIGVATVSAEGSVCDSSHRACSYCAVAASERLRLSLCSACRTAAYCSPACQRAHGRCTRPFAVKARLSWPHWMSPLRKDCNRMLPRNVPGAHQSPLRLLIPLRPDRRLRLPRTLPALRSWLRASYHAPS